MNGQTQGLPLQRRLGDSVETVTIHLGKSKAICSDKKDTAIMKNELPKRKTLRLKYYDYSSAGAYFVTICTQGMVRLFGDIVGADPGCMASRHVLASAGFNAKASADQLVSARMQLNGAGKMIEAVYQETMALYPNINADKYVIIPNHVHCIIIIESSERADTRSAPTVAIGSIIQRFKSKTTVEYIRGVKSGLYPPFNKRIWHRNYHEHIIRSEEEYLGIWKYIDENPAKWLEDKYYIR